MSSIQLGQNQYNLPVSFSTPTQLACMEQLNVAKGDRMEKFLPAFQCYFHSLPACSRDSSRWIFRTDRFNEALGGWKERAFSAPSVISCLTKKSNACFDALGTLIHDLEGKAAASEIAIDCIAVAVQYRSFKALLRSAEKVEKTLSKVLTPVELPPISISPELRQTLATGFAAYKAKTGSSVSEALNTILTIEFPPSNPDLDREEAEEIEPINRMSKLLKAMEKVIYTLQTALAPLTPDDHRNARLLGADTEDDPTETDCYMLGLLANNPSAPERFCPEQLMLLQTPGLAVVTALARVADCIDHDEDDTELESALRKLVESDCQWREAEKIWYEKLERHMWSFIGDTPTESAFRGCLVDYMYASYRQEKLWAKVVSEINERVFRPIGRTAELVKKVQRAAICVQALRQYCVDEQERSGETSLRAAIVRAIGETAFSKCIEKLSDQLKTDVGAESAIGKVLL